MLSRRLLLPALVALTLFLLPAILFGIAAILAYPKLPSLEVLTDYRPEIPLRIYSAEGMLLGEFGEERRALPSGLEGREKAGGFRPGAS